MDLKTKNNKNMKYIIVSTWNGEGYSYSNTAELKDFNNDVEARTYMAELLLKVHPEMTDVTLIGDNQIRYSIGEDNGSFMFIKEEAFGVMILANVNEVVLLPRKKEWDFALSQAIKQSDPDDELDLSGNSIFIGAYEGEYDYQLIKLDN
jgi:hypothetical protein